MYVSKKPSFYYHADAVALGGVLRQPLERIFSTNASVSLAKAGGFGAAREEKFHVDGLIATELAHVRVSGSEHKEHGGFRTIASATIEGLNVLEVVTADRIVAQVSLMHFYDKRPTQISLLGTQYTNLKVNGNPVDVTLDPRMLGVGREQAGENDSPSMAELLRVAEAKYEENESVQRCLVDRLGDRFDFAAPLRDMEENGDALCTVVQPVSVDLPAECFGHVLHVPDFGNIFLGELRLGRHYAELTMLRIEMGCMGDGSLSACSVRPNGRPMP